MNLRPWRASSVIKNHLPQGRNSKMNGRNINPIRNTLAHQPPMIIGPTSKDHKEGSVQAAAVVPDTKNSNQATTILLSRLANPGLTFGPHGTSPKVKEAPVQYEAADMHSKQLLLNTMLSHHCKGTKVDSYKTSRCCFPTTPRTNSSVYW